MSDKMISEMLRCVKYDSVKMMWELFMSIEYISVIEQGWKGPDSVKMLKVPTVLKTRIGICPQASWGGGGVFWGLFGFCVSLGSGGLSMHFSDFPCDLEVAF